MPVRWAFADDIICLGGVGEQRISTEDGERQQITARSILSSLSSQPGVILADEVGMGKTYVALAVIASVIRETRDSGRPVVVMMPPGLANKWPREWEQFKRLCCKPPNALNWVRHRHARTPTEFFRLLDDPKAQRPHIIWMTTNCFRRGLNDPWVKLALIRFARSHTKLSAKMKKRLFEWAPSLVRMSSQGLDKEHIKWLLTHQPSEWFRYLKRVGVFAPGSEDPIPADLLRHAKHLDFGDQVDRARHIPGLATLLRDGTIPGRRSGVSPATVKKARKQINEACQAAYWQWIRSASWRSPLLVLDEAHHAKNDETNLASLFRSQESEESHDYEANRKRLPLLWEKFDRMLFLTATPFQLGHHELIRVLLTFEAVNWRGPTAPARSPEEFRRAIQTLETRLNENRLAGRRLDRLWGELAPEAVSQYARNGDLAAAAAAWWRDACAGRTKDPASEQLLTAITECRCTRDKAQSDDDDPWNSLRPWVIRHNRPVHLPSEGDDRAIPRRNYLPGCAIKDEEGNSPVNGTVVGLPVVGKNALPFLLAARAQGALAHGSSSGRAFFAEGLCSSYEAFHHTRENRGDARDVNDDGLEQSVRRRRQIRQKTIVPIEWYEERIARLIPSKRIGNEGRKANPKNAEERYEHPKIRPVVERTLSLWRSGEKILIFCFYRETAKALYEHIKRELERVTFQLVAEKLGLDPKREEQSLRRWLEGVTRRLANKKSPFHREIMAVLSAPLATDQFAILRPRSERLVEQLAAYVRSPSFIARYLPLELAEVREALSERVSSGEVARKGARALARALSEHRDASEITLERRIQEFLQFVKELAERSQYCAEEADAEAADPLDEYLGAIAVQTGGEGDEEAASADGVTFRVQQPVRLVYGDTKRETRERLMLAFNSPMFPEILISSAVLAEGVDLHRFCRYVIHHDLCWNPSVLEQRTGRLDRIRCKAETSGKPIVVYEPFLAGSADEKMYRVVRDREKWFQIVMGQRFDLDEAATEKMACRVPLPEELARTLVFDLRRFCLPKPDNRSSQSNQR